MQNSKCKIQNFLIFSDLGGGRAKRAKRAKRAYKDFKDLGRLDFRP
jgi:hypothetical protein